jgi:2'-5' RNA ligase
MGCEAFGPLPWNGERLTVRAFIAISLSSDLKAKLADLQREFRHLAVDAAWVREAGFHLTLKFLGEIEPQQIAPINACMIEAVHGHQPFTIALSGVGLFPDESHPRVLWVGIQDDEGHLTRLQRTLEASLSRQGFRPEERPFTPHLTLARLKRVARRAELLACVNRHRGTRVGELAVECLELFESQLHPSGARYLSVKSVPLPVPISGSTA